MASPKNNKTKQYKEMREKQQHLGDSYIDCNFTIIIFFQTKLANMIKIIHFTAKTTSLMKWPFLFLNIDKVLLMLNAYYCV